MFNPHHLMKACLAAVFAIGLAACSSSSDNGSDPDPTATPDPTQAAETEMTTIANAIAAAKRAVDGLTGASSDADVMAANAAITTAHNAITGAQYASAADTADSLEELGAIREDLTTAQGAIDEHRQAATDAANKVALSKKTAIETEGNAATTLARPFDLTTAPSDPDNPTDAENYVVTVEHTGSAVEVTVADGALPADNDPMYEQAATFGNGQMLVRNIGTDRKIIVLHTDIEEDDQVAFSSRYTLTVDRDTDTTANDTYAVVAADNGKIASSNFPSGATTTRNFVEYADTETGRAGQFSGMFDGAPGVYRCVASGGCSVATDADGDFTALTDGQWEFTPAAGALVDVPDSDYLTYGFWLDTTMKDGAIASYDTVQTFATSSLPAATGTLDDVEGTATYEGDAAGVYVHESKNEDGTLDTATSGRFTADVSLKAYFDDSTLRNANTIEGTISNFDLDGGPANSWNVDVSAGITAAFALENGVASGMDGDNGSLSGQLHSPADREAADAPGVLVGEFNANFVNGAVAGGYGARTE